MTNSEFLEEWHNDSEVVKVMTSGSTGEPKVMWVEKRRMEASARRTCAFLNLHAGDTALLCLPADYIAGKMMIVRAETCGLKLTAVQPSGHPLAGLAQAPQFAAMVPMQVFNAFADPQEAALLAGIGTLLIGGGEISSRLQTMLQALPHAVWSSYGMTETLSNIAMRRLNGPSASDWYETLDGVTIALAADGCLMIDDPVTCNSRLTTNDIAEIAPDGRRFRIKGRKDNVICTGGIKVQIEEVERLLEGAVKAPFVITKRKDGKFGEIVVILTEAADPERLKPVCDALLPPYWRPRLYVHTDRLPLTGTGKPARKKAEQLVESMPI